MFQEKNIQTTKLADKVFDRTETLSICTLEYSSLHASLLQIFAWSDTSFATFYGNFIAVWIHNFSS